MRIDVKKCLFVGLNDTKDLFFIEAQKLGVIDFIDVNSKKIDENSDEIKSFLKAIKILRGVGPAEQEEKKFPPSYELAKDIVDTNDQLLKNQEAIRILNLEKARIQFFGKFSKEDIQKLEQESGFKARFFVSKLGFHESAADYEGLIYIGSDENLDYYVSFSKDEPDFERMIEIKIDEPLQNVVASLEKAKNERRQLEQKLRDFAKYETYLRHAFVSKLNHFHLEHAKTLTDAPLDGLFAISGWVPLSKTAQVEELADKFQVVMEDVEIEETDRVPTYLENDGVGKIGEDLVHIYDTPSVADRDPSVWVLFGFALFFAFIVGDGGYGSIYLGLALYLKYKYPDLKGLKKRVLNLTIILCLAIILWGFLMNSFFGINFDLENPIRKYSLITWLSEKKADYLIQTKDAAYQEWVKKIPQLKDAADGFEFLKLGVTTGADGKPSYDVLASLSDGILLELALLIGVVHIIIGMLRYVDKNWALGGWALFLVGAYFYFPYFLGAPSILNYVFGVDFQFGATEGLYFMAIGGGAALILSLIQNRWSGLAEIMNVIQIGGDVLSYLRLYALGLAGAIVASTVNDLTAGLPLIIAIIVGLLAHSVNMALGIMSGFIHGLRLVYLEWYHYSFEGGGKLFKPLDLKKIE